ncbi:hypothetical protein BH11BAC4_BH11BAC4_17030 [soil metagenome]
MKAKLFFAAIALSATVAAQPQLIKQATISTTTTVIAPETEDVQNIQGGGGGNQFMRNFGDGETKSTTTVKDNMVKTALKNEMMRSTIIRDNNAGLTTTLIEAMGSKMGFYATDAEMAEMRVKMDSAMQARRNSDSTKTRPANTANNVEISYVDGSKKFAGYECKKALLITTRLLGLKDTVVVWYNPTIKLENSASTGGTSAMSGFGGGSFGNFTSLNGLDKIDGLVMQYEMNMRRGRRMIVEVTKIDLKKEVTEKDFEISKDFDVKPMKEFQGMMQGAGMQFRGERQ